MFNTVGQHVILVKSWLFRILWEEYVEKLDIYKIHATYKAGDYKTRKLRKIKLGQASIYHI